MTTNRFRESLLAENEFTITWEVVPGRGAREEQQEEIFEDAAKVADGDVVDALSITENPGGTPAISAEYLGTKLKDEGVEPLVHFTAKDKNRNQLESLLHGLEREGVSNVLVMSGDHQTGGFEGNGKPVYDLDPVQLLSLIADLNDGFEFTDSYGRETELPPMDFFPGAVVSPFKKREAELLPQYWKLEKKIENGAEYIITQVGYDARKFHELRQFMDEQDIEVPVIGNLYVLDSGSARAMNSTSVPGAIVTDELRAEVEAEKDGDVDTHEARLERAAEMYAWMKGMGFAGVHVGGHTIDYDDVEEIVDRGEELSDDWRSYVPEFNYPQKDGFYYYKRDPETGLNADEHAVRPSKPKNGLKYRLFKSIHELAFEPDGALFGPMQWTARQVDGSRFEEGYQGFERMTKTVTNDCQECGNCAIFDLAYLCPMSQCPKNERNGPCGGSNDGWCEVYPGEKRCIYFRAYERLKADGGIEKAEAQLRDTYIPPVDWELNNTSSWLNFYMGRDYAGQKIGIESPK